MGFNNGNSSFGFGGGSSGGGGGGGISFVTTCNNATFSLYGNGTAGSPLNGCPILSACPNNALSVCSDGLYASDNNSAVIVLGSGSGSSVRCGVNNTSSGCYSGAFGGQCNQATSSYGIVVGGFCNTTSGDYAFIGSGQFNINGGASSFIGSGDNNTTSGYLTIIGGGFANTTSGNISSILGGQYNTTSGYNSFIGNGFCNITSGDYAFTGSGLYNRTCRNYSNILGGDGNVANSCKGGTIGGGTLNYLGTSTTLSSYSSYGNCIIFIGDVTAQFNINDQIYGYNNTDNLVRFRCVTGSTYSGGSTILCTTTNFGTASSIVVRNLTTSTQSGCNSFIGGGSYNTSSGDYSFNGNGKFNATSNSYSTIINGLSNSNQGQYSSIINGRNNSISSSDCFNTVLNGSFNTICNTNASSCNNTISGYSNTIKGTDLRLNTIFGCSNIICNTGLCCVANNTIIGYSNTICFCTTASTSSRGEGNFVSGFLNNIVGASKLRNAIFGERNCIIDSINQPVTQGGNGNFLIGNCNCVSGTFGSNFVGGTLNTICVGVGVNDNYSRNTILNGTRHCIVNGANVYIFGGRCNCITMGAGAGASGRSFIGAGECNTLNQYPNESAILSGRNNTLNGNFNSSIIDSGCSNTITTGLGFIGNGCLNTASNTFSTILSGCSNISSAIYSAVLNGRCNTASGQYSSTVNGEFNLVQGDFSLIGNGINNVICNTTGCLALGSVVVGGVGNNTIGGTFDLTTCTFTVAPTVCNAGRYSFVGGGFQNVATGNRSAILGGQLNNTCGFADAQILGSCICATQSCTTFTNCLSAGNLTTGCFVCVASNGVISNVAPPVSYSLTMGYTSTDLVASTTYYTGVYFNTTACTTPVPSRRIIVPRSGFVEAIGQLSNVTGTKSSGTPNVTMRIRNVTTATNCDYASDSFFSSGGLTACGRQDLYTFTGNGLSVTAGDLLEIQVITPAWVTAPIGVFQMFSVYINNL